MRKRTLLTILMFACLALFTRWMVNQQSDKVETTASTQLSTIDYDLENFIAQNFDEKGLLVFQMTAPRMSRESASGVTQVTNPRILWPQKKTNKKITLVAKSGLISDDQNEIHLSGNVIVKSRSTLAEDETQAIIIRTEQLAFNQSNRLLTSSALISLTAPGVQLSSVGMSANLNDEKISLKKQVRGQYETE